MRTDHDVVDVVLVPKATEIAHLSPGCLAALGDAETVDIVNAGKEVQSPQGGTGGVVVQASDKDHRFAAMADARGQVAALPDSLAFPSLMAALVDPAAPPRTRRIRLLTAR